MNFFKNYNRNYNRRNFTSFSNIKCINCEKYGHTIKHCKSPIISYGILAYKKIEDEIDFLLVQRKDTVGYIEFIRGKYTDEYSCKILIEEMTLNEKLNIIFLSFDDLWDKLWTNHNSKIYKKDKDMAYFKFIKIDAVNLIKSTLIDTKWTEQEYCIPKGRKQCNEDILSCAVREFSEETKCSFMDIKLRNDLPKLEETFIGSNGVPYKHIYFIAEFVSMKNITRNDIKELLSEGEIKNVRWFSYKNCMNIFRNYESSKRDIIFKANKLLQ